MSRTATGGGSISAYQTQAGKRWEVRWRDEAGKSRRRKGFERRRDAASWLADNRTRRDAGTWIDPAESQVTVGSLASQWDAGLWTLRASTQSSFRGAYRRRVEPHWQDVPVGRIRPSTVRQWTDRLASEGDGVPSIRMALLVLRQILDIAVEDRRIAANPAHGVRLPKHTPTRRPYLTHQQVATLTESFRDPADRALVTLLAYSGIRIGEAIALTPDSVDWLRRRVTIDRAVAEVSGRLVPGPPKNGTARQVFVPGLVTDALAPLAEGIDRDQPLFRAAKGGPFRPTPWRTRRWHPAMRIAREADPDIPDGVTPHALRHTYASLAVSAGASVKALQRQLGHASAAITLTVYSDLLDSDGELVADALDAARAEAVASVWPRRGLAGS